MAAHINTFGLIQVVSMTTKKLNRATVHVSLVEDKLLHYLWETIITVNQGLLTLYKVLIIFFNDPHWDGSGCITSSCCEDSIQPWFYHDLNTSTTDDIEVRILKVNAFNNGAILIDQLELYIQ